MADEYKKYTVQAKRGIKGEAYFESLVSDHCIPHRVVGPKDIGIDYVCEWVYGDKPCGILFAVQVKTFSEDSVRIEHTGIDATLNRLKKHRITNAHLKMDNPTLQYWHGLGIPIYLFVIVQKASADVSECLDCYYKRYTPSLTTGAAVREDPYEAFYLVNEGSRFLAFANAKRRTQGFARDLFIDHVRCCYSKGSISFLNPADLGLQQFSGRHQFWDLFSDYEAQIRKAGQEIRQFLARMDARKRK